jgi:diguanylate cyclase (GGDEF)-like protein
MGEMAGVDPEEWSSFLQSAFLTVLESADEGFVVFDSDGRCRMIGRRAGELFGVEPAAYVGKTRQEVLEVFARACDEPQPFLEAAAADGPLGVPHVAADVEVRAPRPRTVLCRGVPIWRAGKLPASVVFVRDVTRERAAERSGRHLLARIAELTPFDTVTGLLNHRRFREELEREHGRSARAWDSYAVLRLDVDGMGVLNDELGTVLGDAVLEQIAGRLKHCLREYDVVGRLEEDEFAMLLPGADAIAATAVAERVVRAMAEKPFPVGAGRPVSLSIGGALWVPPSDETSDEILKDAGLAMHEARKQGGGRVHVER